MSGETACEVDSLDAYLQQREKAGTCGTQKTNAEVWAHVNPPGFVDKPLLSRATHRGHRNRSLKHDLQIFSSEVSLPN